MRENIARKHALYNKTEQCKVCEEIITLNTFVLRSRLRIVLDTCRLVSVRFVLVATSHLLLNVVEVRDHELYTRAGGHIISNDMTSL